MSELIIAEKEKINNIADAVRKVTESNDPLSLEEIAENINLMTGFIPKPQEAEVGQVLKVASVDENGVPTAWETGAADEKWEKIVEYTVPENCSAASVTVDLDGNPFDLKEAFIAYLHKPALQEDGTYKVDPVRCAVMSLPDTNAAYREWLGNDYGSLVTTPSVACHSYSLNAIPTQPDPAEGGGSITTVYVKKIGDTALHIEAQTSKNGGSLKASTLYLGRGAVNYSVFPEVSTVDVVRDGVETILKELCSIKALHVGGLYDSLGAGSVLRMWGIRK